MDTIFYKYRDWDNKYHRALLTERQLYFANPTTFNDPFDVGIQLRFDLMTGVDYVKLAIENSEEKIPEEKLKSIRKQLIKLWDASPKKNRKSALELEAENNKNIGIVCLGSFPDNILMWSHYGDNHQGFCIGIDFQFLTKNKNKGLYIRAVDYKRKYPEIIPTTRENLYNNLIQSYFTKSKLWEYEQEARLMKFTNDSPIIEIPREAIKAIYLGCRTPKQTKKEIILIAKNSLPNVEFFQFKKNEESFKLDQFLLEKKEIEKIIKLIHSQEYYSHYFGVIYFFILSQTF